MSTQPANSGDAKPRIPWMLLIPLILFVALAGLFAISLQKGDPTRLPSMLIGKPAPAFTLPPVEDLKSDGAPVPGFASADVARGKVSLVNFWASWCTPCVAEHPYLVQLAKQSGAPLFGIDYKDKAENARGFLTRHGSPFTAVGADTSGRTAIDWGVTGVPETFIIDGRGTVIYKHTGPLTPEVIARDLLPVIAKARQ